MCDRLAIMKNSGLLVETPMASKSGRGSPSMRVFTLTDKGHQFYRMLVSLFKTLEELGIDKP